MILNRFDILRSVNIWAIFFSIAYPVMATLLVGYSNYYLLMYISTGLFVFNFFLIKRGNVNLGFLIFAFSTNTIMFFFDSGIGGASMCFVLHIPFLLCSLINARIDSSREHIIAILLTATCIGLTSFTTLTPRLSAFIYPPDKIYYIAVLNSICAISITVVMSVLLATTVRQSRLSLIRSQQSLTKNEALLKSINQNIDIGICRTDVASGKLLYVNNAFIKLFGLVSLEDASNNSIDNAYNNPADHYHIMDLLKRDGYVSNLEVKYKRKDGTDFWGLLTCNKITSEDGNEVYDGAVRDISEIKTLQEELITAKEAAENASIAKSQFLSTMSHEIRTPMNAVIGASNLLLQDEPRKEQLDNLLLLRYAANNLMRLINNILDFSKIELDKMEFEKVPVDLRALIPELVGTHLIEAKRKNIALEYSIPKQLGQYQLDPIRFSQVLNNLLSNALKFTEKGGVYLNVAVLKDHPHDSVLGFSVRDTGIGIATNRQSKIFDDFSQEDIDTTRKFGGSGLGLAITRKIIEKYGSKVRLTSEKGKGSTFSFEVALPKHVADTVAPTQTFAFEQSALQDMDILIVDDNEMNINIMSKFLMRWEAKCDVCHNGEDAIILVKTGSYDLVLMDLHMPGMDGFQATREIRAFNNTIPIFALTADAFAETRLDALACGMNDFVPKPFDPLELFNKVAAVRVNKVANLL
jgi:PAS domain S-box-containing protein